MHTKVSKFKGDLKLIFWFFVIVNVLFSDSINFQYRPCLSSFFYNSLFSAKSWQNPANIDWEEQNKKIAPTGDWTHNLQIQMRYWLC